MIVLEFTTFLGNYGVQGCILGVLVGLVRKFPLPGFLM